MSLEKLAPSALSAAAHAPLTPQQQQALTKLKQAAQQMESLFVNMLFKEMRKTAPEVSLSGKVSNAEQTWSEMLDEQRSEALSKTDSLGIAKVLEQQLRSSVLANSSVEAKAKVQEEQP
jgi:Rod binding domain-containing protein